MAGAKFYCLHAFHWWQLGITASIEVGLTALAWPKTMTLNALRAMVMTYSHAKVQGQRSVSSEDRVETNGQRRLRYLPR